MRYLSTLLLLFSCLTPLKADPVVPAVVVSLKPLQLIADEIMSGLGQSQLLVKNNINPHHIQLRPSQVKMATRADLMIWVSNDFETGLRRLQKILPESVQQMQLLNELPQSFLLSAVDNDGHQHQGEFDGHIWLSPEMVTYSVTLMANQLARLDPDNGPLYQQNAQRLRVKLKQWKQDAMTRLSAEGQSPGYILDHQFLRYFEHSFDIHNAGSLHDNQDRGSSMQSLSKLYQNLKNQHPEHPIRCLLVPQMPLSSQLLQFSQTFELQPLEVSILGKPEHHQILDLLDDIVEQLEHCH